MVCRHIPEPYTGQVFPARVCSVVKPPLCAQSDFSVAIAAIDRSAVGRLKRHFGVFAAVGACGRKHLAREPIAVTTVPIPLCLPCLSAWSTALGFISIAPGLIELLFPSGEAEVGPTVGTLDCFVLKTHWMTSSLKYLVRARVIQILELNQSGFYKEVSNNQNWNYT